MRDFCLFFSLMLTPVWSRGRSAGKKKWCHTPIRPNQSGLESDHCSLLSILIKSQMNNSLPPLWPRLCALATARIYRLCTEYKIRWSPMLSLSHEGHDAPLNHHCTNARAICTYATTHTRRQHCVTLEHPLVLGSFPGLKPFAPLRPCAHSSTLLLPITPLPAKGLYTLGGLYAWCLSWHPLCVQYSLQCSLHCTDLCLLHTHKQINNL